ncbi:ORF166 [Staphylococcus phage 37]|uniref:ORF166 n=1 Tax=Staphylococcus phage 37 TaxID=2936813 RepID=Q4ZC90_9CAUD|nr:ORF166 [Staphylococcus phage 37]
MFNLSAYFTFVHHMIEIVFKRIFYIPTFIESFLQIFRRYF